jgi:hypothetical protein
MPEFPAYSERGPQPVKDGDEWTERLLSWSEDGGERREIGTVLLKHSGTGAVKVTAELMFHENRERATYRGPVPGGHTWKGESNLHLDEGDPGFPQTLKVRCWNPKRWG